MHNLRIHVEPSINDPQTCKFVLSEPIHQGAPFFCSDDQHEAPLAKRLFALSGIAELLIDQTMITVTKKTNTEWARLAPMIGQAIRVHVQSGEQAVTFASMSDADIAQEVERILTTEINPGIEQHKGKIELLEVKDKIVYLKMLGGCQGCGAAQLTLSFGVENTIKKAIPSVIQVVDKTNHEEGKNPYYQQNPEHP